jgi:hypothetical protein
VKAEMHGDGRARGETEPRHGNLPSWQQSTETRRGPSGQANGWVGCSASPASPRGAFILLGSPSI